MRISLIVAMDRNGLIGTDTNLPWRLSADLRRFRKLTTGHPIIMGRKTLESIGGPLKERLNIVLTRQADFRYPDVVVVHSLNEALASARAARPPINADETFIIGGADVYRQAWPMVQRVYLTIVDGSFTGNVWFPFDESFHGTVVHEESVPADAKNPHAHRFLIVDLKDAGQSIRQLLSA